MNKPQAPLSQGVVKQVFVDQVAVTHIQDGKERTLKLGGPAIKFYAKRAKVGETIGFDDFLAPFTVRRISQPQA